ncbi:MAG: hypothetical protein ABH956_00265 [Candidatus Nealsonbacteria bacterium]
MDLWSIIIGLLGGFSIREIINSAIDYKYKINKFKFETIYEKRVEVLSELYKKIDKTERLFQSLMAPFQEALDLSQEEKAKNAAQSANDFLDYFNENKIYLNDNLERKINFINKELRDAWIIFKYANWEKNKDIKEWKKAWDKVKNDIPVINEEIKKEFRKILGIK